MGEVVVKATSFGAELGFRLVNFKTLIFTGVLASLMVAPLSAQSISFSEDSQVELRMSLGSDFTRGGTAFDFERSYLRVEGGIGLDFDFGNFVVSPRIFSYGWKSELSAGRTENNELQPSIDLSFGEWVVSVGDIQGHPLPLPSGVAAHTVIETRPIYAYYANRQDTDAENSAPINGFRDNTRTTSSGKIALAYTADNWFLRTIVDPGLVKDHDPVANVDVARRYYRLEGGMDFALSSNVSLRTGAAIWHQDSYQNTFGTIVDSGTGSKAVRWGDGATGTELGLVLDFGKLDVGISASAIRGPYSDPVFSTGTDDLRSAVHLTSSYQLNDTWSFAGTYSQTRWELSNNPVLGLQTGRLLQIGAEVQLSERVSAGLGYVWSDSSGWSGGAAPVAELSYPVLGVGISF